ncbi:hypothetical protein PVAND_013268 [Polypedilum vanderplanki]|uniref:Thioredoxin domain-containing protein n=1 Tax=Polypedilum vanderplanki TaxID=319348 RepID=A0A9J6CQ65_POLVA|nr:hypothetical protein PVAND_013268 [Polypedilum vanderplanki]
MTCLKLFFYLLVITIIASSSDGKPNAAQSSSGEYVSTPLTNKNYKEILKNNKYVFIKFYTDWCAFSKKILKIWENVGEHYEDSEDILIAEMDCGKFKPICQKFNVREYPTLIIFKDGKRFERYIGPRTTKDFVNYIDKFIAKRKIKDLNEKNKIQQQQ